MPIFHQYLPVFSKLASKDEITVAFTDPGVTIEVPESFTIQGADATIAVTESTVAEASEVQVASSDSIAVGFTPPGITVTAPGTFTIQGADVSIAVAESTSVDRPETQVQSTDAVAVSFTAPGISVQESADFTVQGADVSLALSETTNYDSIAQEVQSSDSITVGFTAAGVSVQAGASVTVQGGDVAISVSESSVTAVAATVQSVDSVTVGFTAPTLDIQAGSEITVQGSDVAVSVAETSAYDLSYFGSFLAGGDSVSASACTGSNACETNSSVQDETDTDATDSQGDAMLVTVPVGTFTDGSDGTVTVYEEDGSGNTLDSHSEPIEPADANSNVTFTYNADPSVQQIRVETDLTADSVNTSGQISCSSDSDCSNETAEIDSAITVESQ